METESETAPPVGTLALDTARGKVGEVMDHVGSYVQMRPRDGGREWDVLPEDVQPLSAGDALTDRVAEANRHSRRGVR